MEKLRRLLAGLSVAALLTSVVGFSAVALAQTFSDVDTDHWAYTYVEDLYGQGVVEGYGDGTYGCDDTANRAEFSKMAALAFGFDVDGVTYDPGFTDVPADAWYYPYVAVLAEAGVVGGYTDADGNATGEFGPGDTMNRAAASKMLTLGGGLTVDTSMGPSFSDVEAGTWYYDYVETLYANSVVDGYGDGLYGPGDDLTRCALAKMVVGTQNPVPRVVVGDDDDDDDVVGDDDDDDDDDVVVSDGTLTVEMGDAVSGGSVPQGATAVDMLNLDLTATGADVVLNELIVHRTGVGSSSDFTNVYLYDGDDRLTTGRTVSSDTNNATFSALSVTVPAGDTVTVTIVADFSSSAGAANTDAFELLSADYISHNGTATDGSFPFEGEEFTISGSSAGTITIEKYGTLSNPTVGESGAEIAKFKLSAANEDIWLNRVALRVRGSISSTLVTNFTLSNASTEIATSAALNANDLMVFVLDEPIEVERGGDEVFTVTADIGAADSSDTIVVDLDEDTDLVAIGEVYGYGAAVTSTSYDGNTTSAVTTSCTTTTWDDASCVTVEGGQVTINSSGPASDNVAVNQDNVEVFDFTITSQVDVEVRKLTLALAVTTGDAGSDTDDLINAAATANFTNIKITDTDTGTTVGSAQDVSTSGSDTSQTFDYTDIFYVDAGETRNLQVTLNIANNADLANEEFTLTLNAVSTSEGIRDVATGDYVTDIVPSGAIAGNAMTILSPSLAVAIASSPISPTVVKGSDDVDSVGFSFTAGKASDINVAGITLTALLDENLDGTYTAGTDNSINASDMIEAVNLYDGNGVLLSNLTKTYTGTNSTVAFTGMDWTIPAGGTSKLVAVADVYQSGMPHNSDNDIFLFDIADVSAHVTAYDEDGNTVTGTGDYANCTDATCASPSREVTVKEAGKITLASSTSPVLNDKAVAGADDSTDQLLIGRFKVYATDEDFKITEMQFNHTGDNDDAIDQVYLKYPTSIDYPGTLDGLANVSLVSSNATFTALEIMVPESEIDENAVDVEVYVTTNEVATGGTATGNKVALDFDYDAGFKALGQGSSTSVTQNSTSTYYGTAANVTSNDIALYKSLPTFAKDTSGSAPCPTSSFIAGAGADVYCFTVTADENGDVGLYQLTFDATPNLLNTGSSAAQLANALGWDLYEYDSYGNITETVLASGTWADDGTNSLSLIFDSEEVVTKGTTSYFVLRAPITTTANDDTSSLSIRLKAESTSAHQTSVVAASASGNNIWSDRSITSHSYSTADWTDAYKLENLPSAYLQLTES